MPRGTELQRDDLEAGLVLQQPDAGDGHGSSTFLAREAKGMWPLGGHHHSASPAGEPLKHLRGRPRPRAQPPSVPPPVGEPFKHL